MELTDREIEEAFDKDVFFDHNPTTKEIFLARIRNIIKADREKNGR